MNLILDIATALLVLGLPVGLLSWYMSYQLTRKGYLDSGGTLKQKRSDVGGLKKSIKAGEAAPSNFLEQRWMKFGGGFYGLTALTTFFLIELQDLWGFVVNFPGFGNLFGNGVIAFVVGMLVNQLQNIITSFIWFGYWAEGDRNLLVWVLVPYLAYLAGLKLAGKSFSEIKQKILASLDNQQTDSDA